MGVEGGRGLLGLQIVIFTFFFFEGFCRDEFYANIMM